MKRFGARVLVLTTLVSFALGGAALFADDRPSTDASTDVAGTVTTETGPEASITAVRAVDQDVRAVLAARQVEIRPQSPGVGSYLRDVGRTVSQWLGGWLEGLAPELIGAGRWLSGLDPVWLWLALAGLGAWLVTRMARSRPVRTSERSGSISAGERPDHPERPVGLADRAAVIEASLEAGDVPASLEALWWWLAGQLGFTVADPSWTSRELVTRAQRADLLPLVRRFDGLIYGPNRPSAAEVRGFWRTLRGDLEAQPR